MMSQRIRRLIQQHIMRRPEARAQDIYKLLYQGAFGVGHILSNKAWKILVEEANRINLEEHKDDPLIEPVSPDETIVRVNLRQYITSGGDLEKLFHVMKESAKIKGNKDKFLQLWSEFKELNAKGTFSFSLEEIKSLDRSIYMKAPEPQHHTEAYRNAYYPAYRVVSKNIFRKFTKICD
jgi:hypothetical protein